MHTYYVTLDSSLDLPNGSQTRTIRCCCSTTFISPPVWQGAAGLSGLLSCSLCQTIWTRGLPARDSSSINGLVLDKSFLYILYYHGVNHNRPRGKQHGDINPDPPATAQLQHAILRKPYGLVPFLAAAVVVTAAAAQQQQVQQQGRPKHMYEYTTRHQAG